MPRPTITERHLDEALALLNSVQEQIRSADDKVENVIAANALLIAAFAFGGQQILSELQLGGLTALEVVVVVARGVLLVAIVVSTMSAVAALTPRMRLKGSARPRRSLFYFGHVGDTTEEAFIEEFINLGHDTAIDQILSQVHVNAVIAMEKHRWLRRSTRFLSAALVLWVVVYALSFLS